MKRQITVNIDPDAWGDLLEAWGDGSIDWDADDRNPVQEGVIDPINEALGLMRL